MTTNHIFAGKFDHAVHILMQMAANCGQVKPKNRAGAGVEGRAVDAMRVSAPMACGRAVEPTARCGGETARGGKVRPLGSRARRARPFAITWKHGKAAPPPFCVPAAAAHALPDPGPETASASRCGGHAHGMRAGRRGSQAESQAAAPGRLQPVPLAPAAKVLAH